MTLVLRIMLIIISMGTTFLMMRKIRQAKVQIEAAIFWVIFAIILVLFSIFPPVADMLARLLGIYSTPNFLFLSVIFLLMIKVFYMTIHISQLETQLKTLVQKMALDEKENEEKGFGKKYAGETDRQGLQERLEEGDSREGKGRKRPDEAAEDQPAGGGL